MAPSTPVDWLVGENPSSTSYKTRLIAKHILAELDTHRQTADSSPLRPLMVALQGPQGSGKTTVTTALKIFLEHESHDLRVSIISIDDFYLDHAGLVQIAAANPGNHLLAGRGLSGTHDLPLARETLQNLIDINLTGGTGVNVPIFDKSLHGGEGDRIASILVAPPLDIVILEGWSIGFASLTKETLQSRYEQALSLPPQSRPFFASHPLEHLFLVNDNLTLEAESFYPLFTVFIEFSVSSLNHIYQWRLQQEQAMMAKNGGIGMNADQVRSFVTRYLPAYELWGDGIRTGKDSKGWEGRGLSISLGPERQVESITRF